MFSYLSSLTNKLVQENIKTFDYVMWSIFYTILFLEITNIVTPFDTYVCSCFQWHFILNAGFKPSSNFPIHQMLSVSEHAITDKTT
jgi:hypothetical protein